eukprot:GHVQ01020619.1.p1 GENE.GHVQ01020619.1~~GHVQ01020619.1.p1  ORF type:complete len:492 (+),score=104.97 GHVQ01020619.1:420-1895(+)
MESSSPPPTSTLSISSSSSTTSKARVDYREYLKAQVNPILEGLVTELLLEVPDDPLPFMIQHLSIKANIPCQTNTSSATSSATSSPPPVCSGPSSTDNKLTNNLSPPIAEKIKETIADKRLSTVEVLQNKISELKQQLETAETRGGSDTEHEEGEDSEEEDDDVADLPDVMSNPSVFNNKYRGSVSAEAHGQWNKKKDSMLHVIEKSTDQKERIRKVLEQSFLFQSLEVKEMNQAIDCMAEVTADAQTVLIQQGDDGDVLYVVESGELECFQERPIAPQPNSSDPTDTDPPPIQRKLVKTCTSSDAFGELALLYNCPRAATVIAKTACILWSLNRQSFNQIVKDSATRKRDMYDKFLQDVPILQSMNAWERAKVADGLRRETFTDGTYIVRQGESGDRFYIIEDGHAVATKAFVPQQKPKEVMSYKEGDYFGELALIENEPRAANVIATGRVVAVSLDRKSFTRLLGPLKEILTREAQRYQKVEVEAGTEE